MSYADSAPVAATLTLEGVWLHDPDDPDGTALNLRYGKAARSRSLEVAVSEQRYAGREYPVADYGPFTREQVTVRSEVPFGPDWSATLAAMERFILARQPVMLRDNRGRCIPSGLLSGYQEQDAETGTTLAFTVSRVDG